MKIALIDGLFDTSIGWGILRRLLQIMSNFQAIGFEALFNSRYEDKAILQVENFAPDVVWI